jgi:hypothetical protein
VPESAEVDELLVVHIDAVAATARRLRRVILDGHPQLTERVRPGWHSLNYADPAAGFVCAVFPFAERVQLVFERGAMLPDPDGLLGGSGRTVRTLEFTAAADVDPAVVLGFLDLAVELGAALRAGRRRRDS